MDYLWYLLVGGFMYATDILYIESNWATTIQI
jgi:hypothetical protein